MIIVSRKDHCTSAHITAYHYISIYITAYQYISIYINSYHYLFYVNFAGRRPSDAMNEIWDSAKLAGETMIESTDVAGYENCPSLQQMQNFTKNTKKTMLLGV